MTAHPSCRLGVTTAFNTARVVAFLDNKSNNKNELNYKFWNAARIYNKKNHTKYMVC
jgi:hypothetical protein